jgi:bifunctional oligoribonuclease and PAP phosphatase NrnA
MTSPPETQQRQTLPILQWREATEALNNAQRILIVTHINPDGDAIGSMLGLGNQLRHRGKDVTTAVDAGVPGYLAFLPGADAVVAEVTSGDWDLLITTDASDEARIGEAGAYGMAHSQQIINLDHHVTNTQFGDIHLINGDAVSATEIVFDWWRQAQYAINHDVALPLLTGLVTDTLGFRTSSVTASTLEIAQQLMQAGASLSAVTARTLDSRPYEVVRLWKQALPSTQLDGQVIHATVSLADAEQAGLDETTEAGLVGFLIRVEEARIAIVFKEKPDNTVEISMRAKLGYDVAQVAFELGGGGHKQAAGASITGSLSEVKRRVLPLLHQAVSAGQLIIE